MHLLYINLLTSIYILGQSTYHWCSSSLGEDMTSSKKGTSSHALRWSGLGLRQHESPSRMAGCCPRLWSAISYILWRKLLHSGLQLAESTTRTHADDAGTLWAGVGSGTAPAERRVLERVLQLTQGQMVVSYVIMESIAWNRVSITISLCPIKGQSRDWKNTVTVGCSHSCVTTLQRYILDRSPARPGPP